MLLRNRSDLRNGSFIFANQKNATSIFVNLSIIRRDAKFCEDKHEPRPDTSIAECGDSTHLKMLIQAVGVPILELPGALAPRGGLRLLHPWNTDSRALGHAAAEAVPESRQHGWPGNGP